MQGMHIVSRNLRVCARGATNDLLRDLELRWDVILAQEFGCTHDFFKQKLETVFSEWKLRIETCLQEAKDEGSLASNADCKKLAEFFWIGWEGAVMHSKLNQNKQAMELFGEQFFKLLPKS